MKLKLLSLALIISSNLSFAGNTASSTPKTKFKIASAEALKKRLKKTSCSESFLNDVKFVEIFADKEMTTDELEKGFTTIYNNLWVEIERQAKEEMGTIAYYAMIPLLTGEVNRELSKAKPDLLAIILEEDFSELYTQLSGVATLNNTSSQEQE